MIIRKSKSYYVLLVLIIPFFFSTPVYASPDVGLSVAGPILNQTYTVTHGQTIEGYLLLENTGGSDSFFVFDSEITSGPSQSVKIRNPSPSPLIPPECGVRANWTFEIQPNATGVVIVRITATITGTSQNGSVAQASISGNVYFAVDPNALSVRVRVIDQYGWPIEKADIELVKGFLSYVIQRTDQNGTTKFSLSNGTYLLRAFLNGFLKETAIINITEDRLFTFEIFRTIVSLTKPASVPIIEYGFLFFIGYVVRAIEKRKRKRVKKPKSEFEYWLEWCILDLS